MTNKSNQRIKQTGEIFTPPELVDEIVDKLPDELFTDSSKTFLDPACGDGEFLRGIVRRLRKQNSLLSHQDWYHTITKQLYGVDIMWDNCCDTVYYLLRSYEDDEPILSKPPETEFSLVEFHEVSLTELNDSFISRKYTDEYGEMIVRRIPDSNHHLQYKLDDSKWFNIKNIVRADSLKEWDFDNWNPL